jgi:aryl-alcohol dehydrogenase-like predicted oxidoreductase
MEQEALTGHCTAQGTDRYYRRSQYDAFNSMDIHHANFRSPFNSDLKLTAIGYGTYMGDPDDTNDYLQYDAIKQSVLSGGLNHIDTAPNYRYMKSERTVGKILTSLHSKYDITRDELFVTSKVGYVPEDGQNMITQREMISKFVANGVPEDSFVKESGHCLHPAFIRASVEDSLKRLNLKCLDVMYLQNPYEAQGPFNTDNVFFDRLAEAFETLEALVAEGKIRDYGLATYSSMRVKPTDMKMHLSLQKVRDLAVKVGGDSHHMRYLQVPINVMMPEAFVEPF